MAPKAEDRRVQRTRKLLREALLALILEKDYETVTVQDIIDRANVGRSTFYAHFLDKQDLLLSGFEELRVVLAQQTAAIRATGCTELGFSREMFEHVHSYQHIYRALAGKQGGAIVQRHVHRMIADLVRDELPRLAPRSGATPLPLELVVQFTVSSFMALLIWWADHDMPYSAEQMDTIFQQLTLPGILAGLGAQ